jgi:two-component system response regulator DesR
MLVQDVDLVRDALAALLAKEHDLAVIAAVGHEPDVVAAALAGRPDVIVIGIDRPGRRGLETVLRLSQDSAAGRVLVLAGSPTADTLQQALDARVPGLLSTDVSPGEVAAAIRRVAAGQQVIESALAATLLESAENPLTERERAVLRIAVDGTPTSEIATRLCLAPGTIRNHLSAIMRKTGARNRMEAARLAQDAGWL